MRALIFSRWIFSFSNFSRFLNSISSPDFGFCSGDSVGLFGIILSLF